MDSQTNLNANNSLFNIGLDPNLHPLLAPESILPTTSLLAPLEVSTLRLTALSTIYTDGATNPNNILYAPLSQTITSNPILNSLLNPPSLNPPFPISYAAAPSITIVAPPQPTHNFAIQAGGIVTFNGKSDLDGNPLDLTDDAFVYAEKGFTLNGNSILPVQRNAAGNALTNSQGKLLLLDQALVVAPGYLQSNSNGNSNYTNLNPPQVIAKQAISIPSFSDIKQQELANRMPVGAVTVTFNTAPLSSQFPSGGTATQPKVIRINNGGLNIPNNVNLSNSIIIVENGDISFNGKGTLTNVVLVANNGNINLNQTETENSSFLAAGRINTNSKASLGGKTLLANGQGDITFNGDMKGTSSSQNLRIVSQGRITFNGKAEVRGDFRSVGTFSSNGKADIYGTVASLGDIVFNGASTFTYTNLGNIQPNSPTLQLAAISDTGVSNSDKITSINTPIINGTGDIGATIKINDGNVLIAQTTVGSDGKWQVVSSLLTNGNRSLIATATDIAGNISTASAPLNLVIDTVLPQLTLTTPLTQAPLNSNSKLTGTINGTGSALVSINYRWDNSPTLISIAPNATGGFDQQLDYTGIANGTHTIAIVSTDIAGNIATSSYNVTVAIAQLDTQAPVITAKLSSDTGISNSDKITFTPTITGTINDASQIAGFKASFDGVNYVNILPQKQVDGTFTLDKTQLATVAGKPLVDGNYTLRLIATDEFGNASQNYDVAFTLDTTITVPANLKLAVGSDTGASNSDNITNINTPTITGTGDIGATIKLTEGTVVVGQTTVGTDGKWQVVTSALTNGAHSILAVATDIAGSVSTASASLNLVIDSIAPQLILNSPLSTLNNNAKLTGSVNGTGSSIASVNYYWDNSTTLIPIAPNSTGGFDQALDYTGIANGTHKLTISATDIAGNVTNSSYNVTVAIDKTAPIIIAKLSTDTGISNSDKITFTPTITGTITDASQIAGFKASFDGINYVNILPQKQADGTFTLDKTQLATVAGKPLVDGNYTLRLIATDEFGNASQNYDVAFTLDTTITVPANLKLAVGSDTGASNSDNITNINTPTINGTGDIGATIKLNDGNVLVGQTTVSNDGKWQIVSSPLTNGSHNLTAIATDIAGNISTASAPLSIVIDALLPQLTLTTPLTQTALKNDAKLVGTIDGTGSNLVGVTYRWDNSTSEIAITPNSTGGFNQGLDFTGINNGSHSLTITATDIAGNILTSNYNVNVALDKEAPIVNLQLAADTGTNTSDKITNNPTITGKVTDVSGISAVKVSLNPNLTNSINITTSLQADGTFSLDKAALTQLNGGQLPDGNYQVYLQAIDNYGNTTTPQTLAFQLLSQALAPTNLQLLASSDTGASNSDGITKTNQPTLQGNGKAGDKVQLLDGNVLVGQTTVGNDGKWQITSGILTDGTHNLTATATDIAGNISANSTSVNIQIDSLAPQLTLTQILDNATLVNSAKLTGTINGSGSNLTGVSYQWDSGNQIAINPNFSGNFDQPLDFTGINNGVHSLTITATDLAGNILTKNYTVNTALDKTAPVITAGLAADTGASNSDRITFTPTITGTITDANQIAGFKASFDGINYVNILAQKQTDGTFTLDKTQLATVAGKPLVDGNYTLHLIATDEFGNASGNYDVAFTLDTTINIPTNLKLALISDTGVSNSDNITSINTPTISGSGDIGTTIKINDGNVLVGQTTVSSDGTWQIVSMALTNGTHSLTAVAIDLAGNISNASAPLNLVIDALIPQLTLNSPLSILNSDTKLSGNIDGTGSNIVGVNYRWDNSTTLIPITPNSTGGFDQPLDFTGISNGSHTITIAATDIAGNIATNTYNVNVAANSVAPVIALKLAVDTGVSNSDGITNNATIGGNITTLGGLTEFKVSLDGTNYTDITASIQPDGTFTLTKTQLATTFGKQITDGNYTLYAIATDSLGNISTQSTKLNFTLDTTNPLLAFTTPTATGTYSTTVPFKGTGSDNLQLNGGEYQIDGKSAVAFNVSPTGEIDLNLAPTDLTPGTHRIDIRLTDIAGNTTTNSLDFTTGNNFTISPSLQPGWGVTTANSIALTEGKSLVTQTSIPVTLGAINGQKLVEFDVKAIFDNTDKTTASSDQFAVYLVNTTNNQTLLDKGISGTALFTLIGDKAEYAKGIVRYDGTHVKIDLSKVPNAPANGKLVFQLLNGDSDTGSTVNINNISQSLNPNGTADNFINIPTTRVVSGGAVDLTTYSPTNNAKLLLTNTRLDAVTGKYTADLQVQNIGTTALPRQLALQFSDLPPGVTLDGASGSDATGVAYLNLKTAIPAGGLGVGEVSTTIQVTFSDPSLIQFGLKPVFLAGAADVPLTLNNLGTLTVKPGEKLALPLIGTDPNGDPIVLSIESTGNLPTGKLTADHNLVFNPRPDQIGTYTFTLIAKQGNLVTKQNVTLNVIPDPVQTTRISGVIQGSNKAPLAGLNVNVGGTIATTGTDGSFTIELPTTNTNTTLTVSGNGYSPITGQFSTLLGHDLYGGTNNQLERPISLLNIDPNSGTTITPTLTQTITTAALPLAAINIGANTAINANGQPYTGKLNLLEVPISQAPIGFPDTLNPDILATLQGDASFTTAVTITLPNRAGYTAGTKLDLWALSPTTGTFEIVGQGQVSSDGTVVNTISGGIKNSTWFCFAPVALAPIPQADNPYNPQATVTSYQASTPINSSARLQDGVVMETVDVLSYQSLGVNRNVSLHYDSLQADPRQIIPFGYSNYQADGNSDRLIAKLTIRRGDFNVEIPTKQWDLPIATSQKAINAGIQVDLSDQPTGVYQYDLLIGTQRASGEILYGTSSRIKGQLVHVNTVKSQFGSGWGLVGLQELVVNKQDASVLWVDGDGRRAVFVPGTTVNGITSYSASVGDFSKLEKLADGTYKRTLQDQTVSVFGTNGKLQTVTDRNQNLTQYNYSNDKLSEIIDPQGLKTKFTPNEITSPDGRTAALYFADGNKNLTSIRYADNTTSDWIYDRFHLIKEAKDQNGNRGTDEYDDFGRVRAATRKDGSSVTILPSNVLGVVLETSSTRPLINAVPEPKSIQIDGDGNVTEQKLDKYGQTIEVSDKVGKKITTSRDFNGSITKSIDGEGNVISYTYDARNNLTGITYGDLGEAVPANVPPFDNTNTAYPVTNFSSTFKPTQVATGDINGDGIDDVVVVNNIGRIATFLGRPDGKLTLQQTFSLTQFGLVFGTETATVKKVTIADFNGDGINDIVIGYNKYNLSTGFTPAIVSTLLGSSNGLFAANKVGIYAITNTFNAFDNFAFDLSDFALGDFNNDGKLDIAATNAQTNAPNLGVYLSNGTGYSKINTPALRNLNLGGYDSKLAVGDFNKDGKQDLVVTTGTINYNATTVAILTSLGDGTFSQSIKGEVPGIYGTPKVADINKDGKLDIVVNAGNLGVLLSTAGNNFQLTNYGGNGASYTELGDIDKDGNLDIVTVDNSQRLRIFAGKADATFATATNFYNINATPRGLALGDFNGDGKLDVAIADLNAGLNIKLNQSVTTVPVVKPKKTFTYDSKFNQMTSMTDELGRQSIYEIDAANGNRLSETRVVGAVGGDDDLKTSYSYNNRGQILTMTDAKGNLTTYEYNNPLGQLSAVTNALNDKTSYTYDDAGNRITTIDANQRETGYDYDKMNRLKETIGAKTDLLPKPSTKYEYYGNGQIKTVIDPNLNKTIYEYDKLDRLTKTTDGQENITSSKYDKAGNLDYTIDGRGNKTSYEYDERKRLVKVVNPDGTFRTIEYYLTDLVKSTTDESGNKIQKKYDSRNRLVEEIDGKGKSTFFTYDDASQLKEIKDARGKVTKYEYDDLGRKTTITTPEGSGNTAITKTEYDKNGNVTAIIDGNLNRTEYEYDVLNRRNKVKDALNGISTYSYDKVGNLTLMKDANNRDTQYVYDALNRQIEIINPLDQKTNTTYDLAGNIKTVTSPTGYLVSYEYDKNNQRTKISDERGLIQTTKYNGIGAVDTITDAIGNKNTNTYDNRNRLTQMSDDFGADTKTEYYNNGTIRATIDAENHRTEYKYDENNHRTEVTLSVNGVKFTEKVVYDEVGNILSTTDGENRTTKYEYDDSNRRIKTIDPLNHTTLTTYDKVGNITQTTDELGRIAKTEYDVLNRQKSVTQALGTVDATTTAYGYDAVGNITSETDGRNHTTTYTPDGLNRQIKITDTYNDITQTKYYETPASVAAAIQSELPNTPIDVNSIGKIVKTTDANGYSTVSIYDRIGRLTDTYDGTKHRTSHITYYKDDRIQTSTDTFGKVTTYQYNDLLRQTIITDPLGLTTTKNYDKVGNLLEEIDSRNRITQYDYDELNRQKTITDAEGGITAYTYYNDGKTKSIKDAANNITSYTYDAGNRLTQEQSVLGTRTYGYDEVDNQTSTVDRNGRTINYDYDNLNRVKSESWLTLPNTKLFTYTYDQNSNLTSADDGNIKYNYTYDDTDLLTQVDRITTGNPTVSFKYDYDAVGNLTKSDELIGTTLTASTSYKYNDQRNLNTEITQTGVGLVSKLVKFDYDAAGLNTQIQRYANGQLAVTTIDRYDEFGRLVGIKQENSTGVIANSSYVFDNLSRLTSETIDGQTRQIDYDKTDQVKSVTGSNSEAYTYDKNGNRTLGGYVTGVGNKLLSDGTYNYDYDAEGNRTKRTNIATGVVDEYVWDYRNRLTAVTSKDGTGVVTQTVGYEYDVDDQRVSKTVNGVRENYYLDRNQIAFVTDGSGTETFHYLYGLNIDSVMAQDSPTGMVWSLGDRLGSINLLADAGGVVVDKRTYDSFGRVLSETNPNVKFRYGYTGRETDGETGLDYYRARYYDAGNGRFISVDPMGFGAGDTNLYRYVGNSSTLYTDPTGEFGQIVGGALFGGLFGGLYALANDIQKNEVSWDTIGNVGRGAAIGSLGGIAISSGFAAVGQIFGAGIAANISTGANVISTSLGLVSSINSFTNNRPLTGALDLFGAGLGLAQILPPGGGGGFQGAGAMALSQATAMASSLSGVGAGVIGGKAGELFQHYLAMSDQSGRSDGQEWGNQQPSPPEGKKPSIGEEGGAEWRYQRYVYNKFKNGSVPAEVLAFERWKTQNFDPALSGGRPGRAGGKDQVSTRNKLSLEEEFINTETLELGKRNFVDMYKSNEKGGIDYVEVDTIIGKGIPVSYLRTKIKREIPNLQENDRLIYIDKKDSTKRIVYKPGEDPSIVDIRKYSSDK
jgi:RHS repeat-associated protein